MFNHVLSRLINGVRSDSKVSCPKEDRITAVSSSMTSKYKTVILFEILVAICLPLFFPSLYIHGGRDIKVGPIGTMWRISLGALNDLAMHNDAGV